jgi:hypothetical protein
MAGGTRIGDGQKESSHVSDHKGGKAFLFCVGSMGKLALYVKRKSVFSISGSSSKTASRLAPEGHLLHIARSEVQENLLT